MSWSIYFLEKKASFYSQFLRFCVTIFSESISISYKNPVIIFQESRTMMNIKAKTDKIIQTKSKRILFLLVFFLCSFFLGASKADAAQVTCVYGPFDYTFRESPGNIFSRRITKTITISVEVTDSRNAIPSVTMVVNPRPDNLYIVQDEFWLSNSDFTRDSGGLYCRDHIAFATDWGNEYGFALESEQLRRYEFSWRFMGGGMVFWNAWNVPLNSALSDESRGNEPPIEGPPLNPPSEEIECENIFGGDFGAYLRMLLALMQYGAVILVIILGIVDYAKVIVSQDKDELKKVTTRFGRRMLYAIAIFLVSFLLRVILPYFGADCNL